MQEIERFDHAVLNSLMAHIAVLDNQGNIVTVNDAWRRFARANRAPRQLENGSGCNYLEVCRNAAGPSSTSAKDCLRGLLAVLDGSSTEFELEYPCHGPTEERWFLMRAVPLLHRDNGLVISHINISERKRAEIALRESREQVQLLLDSTAEAIYGLDLEGRCTFCNPAALQLLGYRCTDDLLGKSMHELIHHSRQDGTVYPSEQCQIYHAFREGRGAHVDNEVFWRADGSYFFAEYWSYPILRKDRIVGAVVTFLDVTERERAAHEMQRMRSYLENIVNSMPSILVGVDLDGSVIEWNREAERVTGVPNTAAKGRYFLEFLPQLLVLEGKVKESMWQRQSVRIERFTTEEDRELRYWDVVIYPLIVAGDVKGAVIRLEDISARIRMEQMLVQTEKMVSLGGLAAGMAHELNNPLGIILQGSQNILRRLSPDLTSNQRTAESLGVEIEQVRSYLEKRKILQFLADLCDSAHRATSIVSNMRAFTSRQPTEFIPVRLPEMLDTAVRLAGNDYDLNKQYDFGQVRITRDYDPEAKMVRCNRTAIQQVLLNIIKNAAQAMSAAGTPPPQRITLRVRGEDDWVQVEVEDNGPGMDENRRNRIFEPFFTTKPAGIGTGLGLSVSYFIITEQHGGSITVESTLGKGTSFMIRLPLQPCTLRPG